MGNSTSANNIPPSQRVPGGHDPTSKQIHISTDQTNGFYLTGERLTGKFEIPIGYLHQYLHNKNNRKPAEVILQQLLNNDIIIELVGDATYSAEVDAAADSNGHATHRVNVCRQSCFVTINQENEKESIQNNNQLETSFDTTPTTVRPSDTQTSTIPTSIKGTFQLQIPDTLPPSLMNNRPPSVMYNLELNLSSSRYRYQIPIVLSSKGSIVHPTTNIQLNTSAINQHNIHLQAFVPERFYRPGQQIPVRVNYLNSQQRSIRSITVTLIQFYRIHNDQYRLQLDGKEWTFDTTTMLPQREWIGETLLQLPYRPLQASFVNQFVGTIQQIECELDYRIFIELNEKKGDDIQLVLPSINVTYQ